jgi:hypothetical protein
MTEFRKIATKHRLPLINIPAIHLDVRELGMSLADVFAADALSATQFSDVTPRNGLAPVMRVVAADGNCWASVVGVSDVGGLIIEPDAAQVPAPRRGRPPKAAEAA